MSTSDNLGRVSRWFAISAIRGGGASDIIRRQTVNSSKTDSPTLSTGTVIGIAVGGAAALFIGLIVVVIHCARLRHRRKMKSRKVDLDDEDAETDGNARLTQEIADLKYVPYAARSRSNSRTLGGPRTKAPRNAKQHLPGSPHDFHITGLRDSWPLVSLFPASGAEFSTVTTITSGDHSRTNSGSTTTPYQLWPQSTQVRPAKPDTVGVGHRARSNTSTQLPVPYLRASPMKRRSMSDNQLTSILRSTSQRLRDAQKRPVSRTLSVLSQVSGNPPADKAPSPPKSQNGASHEDLVREDDGTEIESAKSSVLEMFTGTPSPSKMVARSAGSGRKKASSPPPGDLSEVESLWGDTKDRAIPVAFDSPARRGPRSEQENHVRMASEEAIMVHEDYRASAISVCGRDDFPPRKSSLKLASYNGLRMASILPTFPDSTQSLIERPPLERSTTFGQEIEDGTAEKQTRATLADVSGNSSSVPAGPQVDQEDQADGEGSPFQWYKDAAREIQLKHSARRSSSRRGHKRSKVIRMSGLSRHGSVSVVHEESEPISPEMRSEQRSNAPITQEENSVNGSPSSIYGRSLSSTRLPSTATFGSFAPPSPSISPSLFQQLPSDEESRSSYSATLSMYNFYTSNDELMPTIPAEYAHQAAQLKKSRRHAQNFSALESTSEEVSPPRSDTASPPVRNFSRLSGEPLAQTFFPPLTTSSTTSSVFLPSTDPEPPKNPVFTINGVNINPPPPPPSPAASKLHGPRNLPGPIIRDSVQHSIGLLRRMNSEVSDYSVADSEGSPTLPAYRGGGVSPAKHYRRGSSKYLSVGNGGLGMKTLSPAINRRGRRLRQVGEEHGARERDRAHERYRDKIRDGSVDENDEHPSAPVKLADMLTSKNEYDQTISPVIRMPFTEPSYMDSPTFKFQERSQATRWSEVMSPPMNKSVRHESQLEMPSPRPPPKMKSWQTRMAANGEGTRITQEASELYDDNGFLRSSPDRAKITTGLGMGGMI